MSKQVGVIAGFTATNGIPTYRGYDLAQKPRTSGLSINDYELIFNTFSCEAFPKLDAKKVLNNMDKTFFRIYDQQLDQGEKIIEAIDTAKKEKVRMLIPLNGQVIREITEEDDKQFIKINDKEDPAAVFPVAQKIFDILCQGIEVRDALRNKLAYELSVGKLDIRHRDGKDSLVLHTPEGSQEITESTVSIKLVKETLFYITELYVHTKEFRSLINCEFKEDRYGIFFNKGVLSINTTDGVELTDLERKICEDLIKLQRHYNP